jgi:hypothetical protein
MNEWEPYRISLKPPHSKNVMDLTRVHHIVHTKTSRRIFEDEMLRAGIIQDESKLNKTRLSVTWLSANYWHRGSLYGTVRFTYDWCRLIKNRRLYWVEDIQYRNPAYRFLVTDRDLESSKVKPYDPESDRGPVRLKGGKWYWNDEKTSEFMIESNLPLGDAIALSFVEHVDCREDKRCKEQTLRSRIVTAQTLAFVLGNDVHCVDHLLCDGKEMRNDAEPFFTDLWIELGHKKDRFEGVLSKQESTENVLRGALALYGSGQHEYAKEVLRTFKDQEAFTRALTSLIRKHLTLPNWEPPE